MDTADSVRPYVERAVKDEEVRENVKRALMAARSIYDELIGARGVTYAATRMATDKDLQDNLRSAIDDLRQAADRVQGKDSHKGLPAGPWGRVEVAIAPSDPKIVYAFIESPDSALFASSDGGATWAPGRRSPTGRPTSAWA